MESGLNDHLLYKIGTVSPISSGGQKAKFYYSMSAYIQDNTRPFTELKLSYFWYLLHFMVLVPLLLLGIKVLEKARFIRRRWTQVNAKGKWKWRKLKFSSWRLISMGAIQCMRRQCIACGSGYFNSFVFLCAIRKAFEPSNSSKVSEVNEGNCLTDRQVVSNKRSTVARAMKRLFLCGQIAPRDQRQSLSGLIYSSLEISTFHISTRLQTCKDT